VSLRIFVVIEPFIGTVTLKIITMLKNIGYLRSSFVTNLICSVVVAEKGAIHRATIYREEIKKIFHDSWYLDL
jgi:hypothetical protein